MLDLSGLNPPQKEAVLKGNGPLLVLAGAGSGKTRVITYRVAHMVLERQIPAKGICAVSFTNRAAAEMRERVAKILGQKDASALTMCTFHALGLEMLKAEKKALGFPTGFTVYDTADQMGALREVMRGLKVADRSFDQKSILARLSRLKNGLVQLDLADDEEPSAGGLGGHEDDEYDEVTRMVFPRYQRALRAFAAVDFDDLIGEPVRLLERNEGVRARWGAKFKALLVDEYQDTNAAQLRLIRALAEHGNVTVVGDDDQSIYSWRGADSRNILGFEELFAGAAVVKLEQNYRSTPQILAAANAVIRNNSARYDKTLWSASSAETPVVLAVCGDGEAEAEYVAREIEDMRGKGRRYSDFAILYRSNIQARPLEEVFKEKRIPYDLVGGQKFYDRKEIKDVIAYLKFALNRKDEISLRRVVNYPARGIGPVTLERASLAAQARSVPLWQTLHKFDETVVEGEAARSPAILTKIAGFFELIDDVEKLIKAGKAPQAVDVLVDRTALYDDLRLAAPSPEAASRRVQNVEDFKRSLVKYIERKPDPDALREYLHFLTLAAVDDDDKSGVDQVTLTTIHGSKGLEWPVVFLVGMEEDLLPHGRTLNPQATDLAGGMDMAEERRLAYVAITRGRERLYLTRAQERVMRGRRITRTPSRFLMEIPPELLELRDIASEDRAPVALDELRGAFAAFGASLADDGPPTRRR